MTDLSDDQIVDLRSLQEVCQPFAGEIVVIGAMAFRAHFPGARHTYDIDVAVAVDMEDFPKLAAELRRSGWIPDARQEQRWRSPNGFRFDLLPAGPELRRTGKITWPQSGLVMNLAGFDHVFLHSAPRMIASGFTLKVAPPAVLVLLKMAAYLDRPYERRRDLGDIAELFESYEVNEDRVFSDEVYDAGELDYDVVRAFLLGRDLRSIALPGDQVLIDSFLSRVLRDHEELAAYATDDDLDRKREYRFQQRLLAFRLGVKM